MTHSACLARFGATALALAIALCLGAPASAQTAPLSATPAQVPPQVSPSVKKMLAALPIAGIRQDVERLVATLRQTACTAAQTGCYMAKSGTLQLYFFTSQNAQQTFLLVLNKSVPLPPLLKPNVQKVLGGTSLSDPIISISTADFMLDTGKMPADLQAIVRNSYFGVDQLFFSSGVQLAARATLGGAMRATLAGLGVGADQLTLRAGVVMPIPTDLAGGAGAGAGLADALRHADTLTKAGADAAKPQAYVEFQLAPGSTVHLTAPRMTLTDTTFFIDNALTFGYKGNARLAGTSSDILLHFQTPLNPAGAMDLLDFSFRMAMPPSFTLQDMALVTLAMALPDTGMAPSAATTTLNKLGGGYVGNVNAIKKPLLTVTKPLTVFQLRNPIPPAPYKFGDRNKPFPANDDVFNVYLLGPLADGGPLLYVQSDVRILGQTMGKIVASAGKTGFHGTAQENLNVKLGPLGKTRIWMVAKADITGDAQNVSLAGNLAGQALSLLLAGDTLTISLSASCVNPFEIKATVALADGMDIGQILDGQAGANVDPSQISGCVGQALQAALAKIAGDYQGLSGYSAAAATAALNKINSDAAAAAKAAQDALDAQNAAAAAAAALVYKQAKDAARTLANNSNSAATNALKDAGNAISGAFGKKKKSDDAHDKFDRTVFNWDYYYDTLGMAWGNTDLVQFWSDHGFAGGDRASYEFDPVYYRNRHPGVNNKDLLNYWLKDGINGCDQSSADFSLAALVRRYPGSNCRDTFNWWLSSGGVNSGLNGRP